MQSTAQNVTAVGGTQGDLPIDASTAASQEGMDPATGAGNGAHSDIVDASTRADAPEVEQDGDGE